RAVGAAVDAAGTHLDAERAGRIGRRHQAHGNQPVLRRKVVAVAAARPRPGLNGRARERLSRLNRLRLRWRGRRATAATGHEQSPGDDCRSLHRPNANEAAPPRLSQPCYLNGALFPIPYSLFPIPYSLFPIRCSLPPDRTNPQSLLPSPYSVRMAVSGSTRSARSVGSRLPRNIITTTSVTEAPIVAASAGFTPASSASMLRPAA